jgi:hypothetical protein
MDEQELGDGAESNSLRIVSAKLQTMEMPKLTRLLDCITCGFR